MKKYIKNILEETLKDEVVVEEEWNRLFSSINKREKKKEKSNTRSITWRILPYVAAVLTGFLLSIPVMRNIERFSNDVGTYQMITQKGEKSRLKLPDGSSVWLNNCTTIEYDDEYGISNRDIHLNGEAYFEVAKNKNLPFIVKTDELNVRAIGTCFNVLAYSKDSHVITTLYEGKLAINSVVDNQELFLETNQVAVYDRSDNKISKRAYNDDTDCGWREGYFMFNMISLQEIATVLERNFEVSINFQNEKIKDLKFKGVFKDTESIEDILKIIMINTGIRYYINNDSIIIE